MAWWNNNKTEEDLECIEQCKVVTEQATKTTTGLIELKETFKDKDTANSQAIVLVIDDILNCINNSQCLKDIKTIADNADKKK